MTRVPLQFPKAVLFDMDGTLTKPMLDFAAIKAEMGIGSRPILEAMGEMDPKTRAAAQQILDRHEQKAAIESELNEGCQALLKWIRDAGVPTALITRNAARSVSTVLEKHRVRFDVVIAREDGPFKPDPWSILHVCERLQVPPQDAWMVGDGQYDIEAGNAAGAPTIWVSHDRPRVFTAKPTAAMSDLGFLLKCLIDLSR